MVTGRVPCAICTKGIDPQMITITFDVNNSNTRQTFLMHTLIQSLDSLTESTTSRWGKMTAQHMVEHLLWTFEFSTGKRTTDRDVPQRVAERLKQFLYNNKQTPQLFKNPILEDDLPELRFSSLTDAKHALRDELNQFLSIRRMNLQDIRNHPIFGFLGGEEWERTHYKHCIHHLLQFGLIILDGTEPV
jgi:hypothetical protein